MRNDPVRYHVLVTSATEARPWWAWVMAFNKIEAAFRAGALAEAAGVRVGRHANFSIHQDRAEGCCDYYQQRYSTWES